MRCNAPALLVQRSNNALVVSSRIGLQTAKFAVLSPGLFVWLAHPAAFKAAVNTQLNASSTYPFIALIGFQTEPCERPIQSVRTARHTEQNVHAHRENSAPLHFL